MDKKMEIENSCKPQCIKPLLAVSLDMRAVIRVAQTLQCELCGHWAAANSCATSVCGLAPDMHTPANAVQSLHKADKGRRERRGALHRAIL